MVIYLLFAGFYFMGRGHKNSIADINAKKPLNSIATAIRFTGTIIEKSGKVRDLALFKCKCGAEFICQSQSVIAGHNLSCGCARIVPNITHGLSKISPLYNVWSCMKDRCYYIKHKSYKRYGGRGIKVCDEWVHDFAAFHEWAKDKYQKGLQLDRIDNDGNYTPDNCRFVTPVVNANNRHDTIRICYQGRNLTIKEWAEIYKIPAATISYRYYRKWDTDLLFSLGKFKGNSSPMRNRIKP